MYLVEAGGVSGIFTHTGTPKDSKIIGAVFAGRPGAVYRVDPDFVQDSIVMFGETDEIELPKLDMKVIRE